MGAHKLLDQLLKGGLSGGAGGGGLASTLGSVLGQVGAQLPATVGRPGPQPHATPQPHHAPAHAPTHAPMQGAGQPPGKPQQAWGGFAGGAAAGSALGLLLGSRRGRKMGGTALKYGSAAALGALAWKAYASWQERQAGAAGGAAAMPASAPAAAPATAPAAGLAAPAAAAGTPWGAAPAASAPPVHETRMLHRLPSPEAEQHSRALLAAMIAAAKADGHVDEGERQRIDEALQRLDDDPLLHRFVAEQLRKPLDPAEVAALAGSPELAAEVYLASLLVADETSTMERLYLDELARQLGLPAGLKAELEAQVAQA